MILRVLDGWLDEWGCRPFEQWDPEGETGMWQDNEFDSGHVEFEGPNISWRNPEDMEPKTGERDETKTWEGVTSENWSKKNERMKEL